MDEIRVNAVMDNDGELTVANENGELNVKVKGLPFKKGEKVEITIKGKPDEDYPLSTAERLRHSRLVGLWKNRTDIGDSVEFARKLRKRADRRQG